MSTLLLSTDRQQSVMRGRSFEPRAYSPYGDSKSTPTPSLAFCGQYRDPLTGNYPLGNGRRYYSPVLMRFISPDSLSPFSRGGINGYTYCGGDPVNRHDPGGAEWYLVGLRAGFTVSSATTGLGAVIRTARNIVGHRRDVKITRGEILRPENYQGHKELSDKDRIANMHHFFKGVAGVTGNVYSFVVGDAPRAQTVADISGITSMYSNTVGGWTGNFDGLSEVLGYMKAYPTEIPMIFVETLADVTMLPDALNNVGLMLIAAANKIRGTSQETHTVRV